MQGSWKDRLGSELHSRAVDIFVNRNYTLFLGGAFISALGSWLQMVALGWLVLELSDSVFLLGLTNFMQMVPLLVLGLFGGAMADRVDRRRLLLFTQGGTTLSMGALALLTATHLTNIPVMLAIVLFMGVLNAFMWPAWSVFIKDLVGPEQLRVAIAVNAARFNLTRVLGPALAGVLLAQVGIAATMGLAAISTVAVMVSLIAITLPRAHQRPARLPWVPVLKEGLQFAWTAHSVRSVMLTTAVLGFLAMPYQYLLPSFARDVYHVGEAGLGLLLAAVGVGAVLGAIGSGNRSVGRRPRAVMAVLLATTGLGLVGLALAPQAWVAMLALAVIGLASIGYLSTANATVQLEVPDAIMGRIMGVWVVVNAGTTPLGSLTLGALADRAGVQTAVGSAGAICALLGTALAWRQRPAGLWRRAPAQLAPPEDASQG